MHQIDGGSDFRMLRQARSPACGSPDTSSTRRRSRDTVDHHDGAVVDQAQFARTGGDFQFEHAGPAPFQLEGQFLFLADRYLQPPGFDAVLAQDQRCQAQGITVVAVAAQVVDPQFHRQLIADDAEGGCLQDRQAAVAFVLLARQEEMNGGIDPEVGKLFRNVVNLSVAD